MRSVEVTGGERFVPLSLVGELRREALETLRNRRIGRVFPHRILPEDPEARFSKRELSGDGNVTNRAAERFYRDHGVERIERGLDLSPTMSGRCVMRTAYCIRREIGACLREGTPLREELYLVRGARRYRLQFDCARCEMKLIDER